VNNFKFHYVGPYWPKTQRKYKQRLLSERESNQPSISTAMSVGERVRRLRERRKFDEARAVNEGAAQTNAKQNFRRLLAKTLCICYAK